MTEATTILSLLSIESPSDLTDRPKYVPTIDKHKVKPVAILGPYNFSKADALPCGLCGTEHQHGYLISASDGSETNIGQECGKNNFGVDFKEIYSTFRAKEAMERRLKAIMANIQQREDLLERSSRLITAIERLQRRVQIEIWDELSPERGLTLALKRTAQHQGAILNQVEISSELRDASISKDHYVLQTVAHLDGVDALESPDELLRRLRVFCIGNLQDRIFKRTDLNKKEMLGIESRLLQAKAAVSDALHYVEAAENLLAPTNIAKLAHLEPTDGKFQSRTRRKIAHFASLANVIENQAA